MKPIEIAFTEDVGMVPAFWPRLRAVLEALGCTDMECRVDILCDVRPCLTWDREERRAVSNARAVNHRVVGFVAFAVEPDPEDFVAGMNAVMAAADAAAVIVRREGLRLDGKESDYKGIRKGVGRALEGKFRGRVEFSGTDVIAVSPR